MARSDNHSKGAILKSDQPTMTRRWLINLGVVLTVLWFVFGFAYLIANDIGAFFTQGASELGGFLEGFFAPLAFLWLVIGLFVQQGELAQNTAVLRQTSLTSEQQTKVLEATELRGRQATYFQIAENVRRQTGNLMGMLANTLVDSDQKPLFDTELMEEHWLNHQQGQYEIFPALLLNPRRAMSEVGLTNFDVYFGTPLRKGHSEEYIRSFRDLLSLAKESDPSGTLVRTTTQTPHGSIYNLMLSCISAESAWVFFKDASPFQSTEFQNIEGRWLFTTYGYDEEQEEQWDTTFWKNDSGKLVGQAKSSSNELEMNEVEVIGSSLFIRIDLVSYDLIFTGRVEGDELSGIIDYREGVWGTFNGSRQSIETGAVTV